MGGNLTYPEVAKVLQERMGEAAWRVPTRVIPNWLLRVLSPFIGIARQVAPELGKVRLGSSEKAKRLLGWQPRSKEDAVVATAESFIRLGLIEEID